MPSDEGFPGKYCRLLPRLVLHRALLGLGICVVKQKAVVFVLGSHVWATVLAQLEFLMYDCCYGFETGSGLAMSPSLALNSLEMMV